MPLRAFSTTRLSLLPLPASPGSPWPTPDLLPWSVQLDQLRQNWLPAADHSAHGRSRPGWPSNPRGLTPWPDHESAKASGPVSGCEAEKPQDAAIFLSFFQQSLIWWLLGTMPDAQPWAHRGEQGVCPPCVQPAQVPSDGEPWPGHPQELWPGPATRTSGRMTLMTDGITADDGQRGPVMDRVGQGDTGGQARGRNSWGLRRTFCNRCACRREGWLSPGHHGGGHWWQDRWAPGTDAERQRTQHVPSTRTNQWSRVSLCPRGAGARKERGEARTLPSLSFLSLKQGW